MPNKLLKSLTQVLLYSNEPGLQYKAVHQLHKLYSDATGINAGDVSDAFIHLPSGKAVSPVSAAHCLLEYKRTAIFLRGIYKAILHLRQKSTAQKIHILYAGSGPFASLVTPLTTLFAPDEICFDMLDINPVSLNAVKRLYNKLDLLPYINRFIEADATAYQIDKNEAVHLVISETMNRALEKEPLVYIMQNLIPQLHGDSIFIPQAITISSCLSRSVKELPEMATGLRPGGAIPGIVYRVKQADPTPTSTIMVKIPVKNNNDKSLFLLTTIDVFDDEVLALNDCSLTLPKFITSIEGHEGKSVHFEYIMDRNPRFEAVIS